MKKIYLYAHGGSGNHGCEAIVRSTISVIKNLDFEKIILISSSPEEDKLYGIDEICEVRKDVQPYSKFSLEFFKAYFALKTKKDYIPLDKMGYRQAIADMRPGDIALSIGGDNYCYADVKNYVMLHSLMKEKGAKTVLWGCSVEPSLLADKEIAEDLSKYDLITARETISYEALRTVNNNTVLVADTAFVLDTVKNDSESKYKNCVGINISPMIIGNENEAGVALANYKKLIEWIIANTDMNIALVPHVVWEDGDDRRPCKSLYDCYKDSERVFIIEDCNCMELKGIISQCRFFVGARTHSTIAAYSTGVPTLVVGYSVKARGIAKDLFGTDENYVLPVQSLSNPDELTKCFIWIMEHEEKIKNHLNEVLPAYKENACVGRGELDNLL